MDTTFGSFTPQVSDTIEEALTNVTRLIDYLAAGRTLLTMPFTGVPVVEPARMLLGEARAAAEQVKRDLEALAARQHEAARHAQAAKHVTSAEVSK